MERFGKFLFIKNQVLIYINGNTPSTETVHTGFVVAGVKIGKSEKGNSSVYGIAFKVVE